MLLESSADNNPVASVSFVKRVEATILLAALAGLSVGCAGISASGGQPSTVSNASKISLSPATLTISSGAQRQFAATLTQTAKTELIPSEIIWHASAGTISDSGLFTAPSVTSSTTVTVTAASSTDHNSVAASQVTVVPLNKIAIDLSPATTTLSSGGKQQFSATMTSTSNTGVTWRATGGTISSGGLFTAPSVTSSSKITVTSPEVPIADPNSS